MREELGNVPGISRSNALTLCVKMTEDEIVIFRDLMDDNEKCNLLTTSFVTEIMQQLSIIYEV